MLNILSVFHPVTGWSVFIHLCLDSIYDTYTFTHSSGSCVQKGVLVALVSCHVHNPSSTFTSSVSESLLCSLGPYVLFFAARLLHMFLSLPPGSRFLFYFCVSVSVILSAVVIRSNWTELSRSVGKKVSFYHQGTGKNSGQIFIYQYAQRCETEMLLKEK